MNAEASFGHMLPFPPVFEGQAGQGAPKVETLKGGQARSSIPVPLRQAAWELCPAGLAAVVGDCALLTTTGEGGWLLLLREALCDAPPPAPPPRRGAGP